MNSRALLLGVSAALAVCTAASGASTPAPAPAGLPAIITSAPPPIPASPAAAEDTPEPSVASEDAPVAKSAAEPDARESLEPHDLARQKLLDQLAGQTQLAQRAVAAGDTAGAEAAYLKLLTLPVANAEKRNALMQMAAFYGEHRQLAKSAVVYEKILALFPDDPANPNLYLDLGRIYRDAGLYDLAISRFYSVLNAAISQNDGQEETRARRNLSLLARFEIAEASRTPRATSPPPRNSIRVCNCSNFPPPTGPPWPSRMPRASFNSATTRPPRRRCAG